jgi:hypothetical protein
VRSRRTPATLGYVAAAAAAAALAVGIGGCVFPLASDEKPPLVPDHTEDNGGALHKPGYETPYAAAATCYTFECHHADLRGGWAQAESGLTSGRTTRRSPSCYQCHGVLWRVPTFSSIEVQTPLASTVWRHGRSAPIEWIGPPAATTTIRLIRDDFPSPLDTLATWELTGSDGVTRVDEILPAWGVGSGYFVLVEDGTRVGQSGTFTIEGEDP